MAEPEGAFRLTFVEGRGLLTLAGRDIPELGRVDRLELEIPNLRFPVDVSGGLARFKNRRLKLRHLSVSFGASDLAQALRAGRLADFGIVDPRVEIDGDLIRLTARALVGEHEAEFTVIAGLTVSAPFCARLVVFDVRLFGFLPVPAPALPMALCAALGAGRGDGGCADATSLPPLLRLDGPSDVEIDLLDLFLLAVLPMYGWRLPERRHMAASAVLSGPSADRIQICFGESPPDSASVSGKIQPQLAAHATLREHFAEAEAALLAGDVRSAIETYGRANPLQADDRLATERLLWLLASGTATLGEAEALAEKTLVHWPDNRAALLVQAIAISQRERFADAAVIYERFGALALSEGAPADHACAYWAAARLWVRAGDEARAIADLDAAVAHRSLPPAVRALARFRAEEGRWDEISPLLARGEGDGGLEPGEGDARGAIEFAELATVSRDPALCGRAVAILDGLLSREIWPDPDVPRAEAARQMALLSEAVGDHDTAVEWLRDCLATEAPARVADLAWQRLTELLMLRHDDEGVAAALRAWAEDERTAEPAVQRSRRLCDSARLFHERLGRASEAMSALESALRLVPADLEILTLAESLAEATGNWSGLADLLRHRLAEVRPEDGKSLLQRLARVLGERLGQAEDAVQSYRLLLDLDGNDGQVRLELARLLWNAEQWGDSAAEYRELLSVPCAADVAGEAHLRLAQWAQRNGQREAARQALSAALVVDLNHVAFPVLIESLRGVENDGELARALAHREAHLLPKQRLDLAHARAASLSRCGRRSEAETVYQHILELAPEDERARAWFAEQGATPSVELIPPVDAEGESRRGESGRSTAEGEALEAEQETPEVERIASADPSEPSGADARGKPIAPIATELSVAELERLLDEDPTDLAVAEMLFHAWGQSADRAARNGAWTALLDRAPGLPAWCHAAVHLALAEEAEQAGQLDLADHELKESFALDDSSSARPGQLTLRARLLVARGQIVEAEADLDEALGLAPEHAGALAAAAEMAFLGQDWERARALYTHLAQLPDADCVVDRPFLAFRRAELAQIFGDQAEAALAFQEVVSLDPSHVGAREALAGLAFQRGDLTAAVAHFEEVLRLLPRDAIAPLTEVRQRLGEAYLGLGELAPARQNLEMALASEPSSVPTLETLITTYERMGLHRDAAASCERLARLLPEPTKKAQALFREGEILRSLGDGEAANDAFLRASDLDPTFGPTLARLVVYYWNRGDWANLRDVGRDYLASSGPRRETDRDLPLLIALGTLAQGGDAETARASLQGMIFDSTVLAARLGELARLMTKARGELAESILGFVLAGRPASLESELYVAAQRAVLGDPGDLGSVVLLATLLDRRGSPGPARAVRDLALFLDPNLVLGGRLAELDAESPGAREAFLTGAADHPLCRGPLRRVLRAFAAALAAVSQGTSEPPEGEPPSAKAVEIFDSLRAEMQAPPMRLTTTGDGADVSFAPAQPLTIVMGRRAQELATAEVRFLLARAFEQARAGTLTVVRMLPGDLRSLLRGIIRTVSVHPSDRLDQDEEGMRAAGWADRLAAPGVARLLPTGKDSADVLVEAGDALSLLPDLDGYLRGCRFTADRVGLLACGSPLVALRALSGAFKTPRPSQPDDLATQRQEQVRSSSALRELISFMLSDEYAALLS